MWKFYYGTATPSLRNGLFILIMMVCLLWLAFVEQKKQSERTPIKFMFMLMFVGFYLLVSRDICLVYYSHPQASKTSSPYQHLSIPITEGKLSLNILGFLILPDRGISFLCLRVKYSDRNLEMKRMCW